MAGTAGFVMERHGNARQARRGTAWRGRSRQGRLGGARPDQAGHGRHG